MRRRKFLLGTASATALATTGCHQGPPMLSPVLSTPAGQMQGQIIDGVHKFLGIPYAEPPFGTLRWLTPVRRKPWSGVLQATQYGQICPQTGGMARDALVEGEDCLNLNIWTPDPAARGLPVMVWAHGGGQVSGSGADAIYDGGHFAQEGVVLVTCNRRLGAEGFLYLEELFGENVGPGNLGMQDLICVLEWLTDNVQSFGGDPNNITLFGESGGAAAAQATIATPGASGLINRAILQSGGHAVQRPTTATRIARHVIDQLGIKMRDVEALRAVPWQKFVELYAALNTRHVWADPQIYLPVLNQHLPVHPVDAPFAGFGLDIDYLVGTCREEANFFDMLMDLEGSQFDRRARKVVAVSGAEWSDVLNRYREIHPEWDADDCFNAALGDMWFRVPSLRIAEGHQQQSQKGTYTYLFEWSSPLIGASHALDLMVFGNGLPLPGIAAFKNFEKTATFMRKAWVAFAKTGSPALPNQSWPSYRERQATLSIDDSPSIITASYRQQFPMLENAITINWGQSGL